MINNNNHDYIIKYLPKIYCWHIVYFLNWVCGSCDNNNKISLFIINLLLLLYVISVLFYLLNLFGGININILNIFD